MLVYGTDILEKCKFRLPVCCDAQQDDGVGHPGHHSDGSMSSSEIE